MTPAHRHVEAASMLWDDEFYGGFTSPQGPRRWPIGLSTTRWSWAALSELICINIAPAKRTPYTRACADQVTGSLLASARELYP